MTSSIMSTFSEESDLDTSGKLFSHLHCLILISKSNHFEEIDKVVKCPSLNLKCPTLTVLEKLNLGEKSLTPHLVATCPSLSEEGSPWFASILSSEDLVDIDPMRGKFLLNLQELAAQKQNLLATLDETDEDDFRLASC